jgi:hypothetical protein
MPDRADRVLTLVNGIDGDRQCFRPMDFSNTYLQILGAIFLALMGLIANFTSSRWTSRTTHCGIPPHKTIAKPAVDGLTIVPLLRLWKLVPTGLVDGLITAT